MTVNRRAVLLLPLMGLETVRAQAAKVRLVGYLSLAPPGIGLRAFRSALQALGYVESHNLRLLTRSADGHTDRLDEHVAGLLAHKVDVLVVVSTATAVAAHKATTTTPIVFVSVIDPLKVGLVASLARPGGNITGIAGWVGNAGFAGKWIELLKEAAPEITRVAVLSNAANPQTAQQLSEIEVAGRALQLRLELLDAGNPAALERALGDTVARGAQGLLVAGDPFFSVQQARITRFAASRRLPAVYFFRSFVEAGGLMSYGAHQEDSYRRAAAYVDRILKGERPADLPVELPARFELVINRRAARDIGLALPAALLMRADDVIE